MSVVRAGLEHLFYDKNNVSYASRMGVILDPWRKKKRQSRSETCSAVSNRSRQPSTLSGGPGMSLPFRMRALQRQESVPNRKDQYRVIQKRRQRADVQI